MKLSTLLKRKQRSHRPEPGPPLRTNISILSRLPLECWLKVLEFLPQRDVSTVSRQCKELHASAEPILYRSIDWEWCGSSSSEPPFLSIVKLLRTVHERPEIAALVQNVSFVSYTRPQEPVYNQRAHIESTKCQKILRDYPTVRNFLLSIVRLANFPHQREWKGAVKEGNPHAYAAILISQMSCLRTLKLDCSFVWDHGWPGLMITHAMLGSPPGVLSDFSRLTYVDYGNNCSRLRQKNARGVNVPLFGGLEGCDRSQYVGWFFLPALRYFAMWAQSPSLAQDIASAMNAQPSNLARLRQWSLNQSIISVQDINRLLPQMKSLEYLRLGLQYVTCLGQLQCVAAMEPGLRSVSGTLTKFILGPHYAAITSQTAPACAGSQEGLKLPHGLFKSFEKLRTLRLPTTMLLGWGANQRKLSGALPAGIKELVLRDCYLETAIPHRKPNEAIHVLANFLLYDVHQYPHLRSITVFMDRTPFNMDPVSKMEREELRQLGGQRHIYVYLMQNTGQSID
ncbi:uncharacterized protein N7482_007590 [Penicillium canariense]|uniref:F-box domain-containing protein n=1 Tax=Penicillium canariense TaxID=189055 RepID=A0A9W9HZD1_9EURO|nr:uncharacterized protein N7482_007590 [Penicillium canariense]KAJ5160586.1 hypothetical protein N7482_007590 [Penicillium canariense]